MIIDELFLDLKTRFDAQEPIRSNNSTYSYSNALMCGFALFSVKDSSLLKFTKELKTRENNLKSIYHINQSPSDTTVRRLVDEVPTESLKALFKPYATKLDNEGILDQYEYINDHLLIPIDGTQYFASKTTNCDNCSIKNHKDGTVTYHHNALAAVIVSPKHQEVFPIGLEDISKQDGTTKNDCELAAVQRLVPNIRKALPNKKIIIGGDALYANGPFIRFLQKPEQDMRFIFSVKEGSQGYLFIQAKRLEEKMKTFTHKTKKKTQIIKYANKLMLNGTNHDILANYIQLEEHDLNTGKVKIFNWITDIPINSKNYSKITKAGRARWKIENEAFNTLKNQGYQFEHNFGHGEKYLSANFALLMMLAFLFDQIQQRINVVFRRAAGIAGSKIAFWEKVRQLFDLVEVDSMQTIYKIIAKDIKLKIQLIV